MKENAENDHKYELTDAAITVPSSFNNKQRQSMIDTSQIAALIHWQQLVIKMMRKKLKFLIWAVAHLMFQFLPLIMATLKLWQL